MWGRDEGSRWMRGENLTPEHQRKAAKGRGRQKTAAALKRRLAKIEAEKDLYAAAAELWGAPDELRPLDRLLFGLLVTELASGNGWQRQSAARTFRAWYVTDESDKDGEFERLIDVLADRRSEKADR